jgi:hypothetical protein
VELAGQPGWGRNRIAREVGISGASVTLIAQQAGVEFDWRETELATRARQIELGAMRSDLARQALVRAFEALDAMSAPTKRIDFTAGSEHSSPGYHELLMDSPTISDQRNLATTFGILVQRATELMRSADGGGVNGAAASMLDGITSGIAAVADVLRTNDPDSDPTADPEKVDRQTMINDLEERIAAAEGEQEENPDE